MLRDTGLDWTLELPSLYNAMTKRQISLIKQLSGKGYKKVFEKVCSKKNKKDLSFILDLTEFSSYRSRSVRANRKEKYQDLCIDIDYLLSACFGYPKESLTSSGKPAWHASQGIRQSFTYRKNMFSAALEHISISLYNGDLNIPLVWSIQTPLTVSADENYESSSYRYSNHTKLKIIALNRLEAEQVWSTVLRPCLGIGNEYNLSWSSVELLGLRKHYDISNYNSLSGTKAVLCKKLEEAKRIQEITQNELNQLEVNFTMVNSTITMANLSYEK